MALVFTGVRLIKRRSGESFQKVNMKKFCKKLMAASLLGIVLTLCQSTTLAQEPVASSSQATEKATPKTAALFEQTLNALEAAQVLIEDLKAENAAEKQKSAQLSELVVELKKEKEALLQLQQNIQAASTEQSKVIAGLRAYSEQLEKNLAEAQKEIKRKGKKGFVGGFVAGFGAGRLAAIFGF